jgi:3-oxoacyl-[acyl-carrier protein] reductase
MAALTDKVAVVTGSSRGIGRSIAERLARDGASVVVNYVQHAESARDVVSTIEASGGKALVVQADLGRLPDVRRLFETTVDHFGHLEIVVHSAALLRMSPLSDVTEDDFDAIFAVNAKGAFFVLQEGARRVADGGRIVYISSCATQMSFAEAALYVGSKAAGEQFAKTLARELGARGITVNSVSPGFTVTDMLPEDVAWREMGAKMSALGRLGQPSEIADVVAFLVSDQGGWVTGQNVQACGGVVM